MLARAARWMKIASVASLGGAALLALGGCESRAFSYTFERPSSGVGLLGPAVDIENDRGTVDIRVEKWRDDIAVELKTNLPGEMTGPQRDDLAGTFERRVEMVGNDGPPVLMIRSAAAEVGSRHRTNIIVRLPECGGVRVRNAGGDVLVVGAAGATQIENTEGDIEVRTDKPIDAPTLLSTTRGDVLLQAPSASAGSLQAEARGGTVTIRNPGKNQSDWSATWLGASKVTAQFNSGKNAVTLWTAEGDIGVYLLDDPNQRVGMVR
jgi:hypothetical protein